MSQEGQKDYQGQQPPEPLPVHPAIIQKARLVQVHQSVDRETEKQLLSQGHQTVKQPSVTLSGCCQHTDSSLDVINVSLATLNNATLYNVYIPYITHLICIYCTLYHLLHLYVKRVSLATLNYATLFTYSSHMYILYSIPSTASCLCRSVPSLIHISLCTYSLSLYTCVYKVVVLELLVRLLVGYYYIVGTRSTSISLHSH